MRTVYQRAAMRSIALIWKLGRMRRALNRNRAQCEDFGWKIPTLSWVRFRNRANERSNASRLDGKNQHILAVLGPGQILNRLVHCDQNSVLFHCESQ